MERGVTRQGLMRDRSRHIKDDSRSIDDPKDRILGWSTEQKIAALRTQIRESEKEAETAARETTEAGRAAADARRRAAAAKELLGIDQFLEINPAHWSQQLIRLRSDKELLENSSTELHRLRQRKSEIETEIHALDQQLRQTDGEVRILEKDVSDSNNISSQKSRA